MDLTRGLDPDTLAAIAGPVFHPVVLVYLDWPDVAVRVHSGVGTIAIGEDEWTGIGHFGEISVSGEGAGLAQTGADLTMVGAPDEIDDFLDAPIRNRAARVLFGATTTRSGNTLAGEPFDVFSGYMDAMRDVIESDGGGVRRAIRLGVVDGPSQRESAGAFHTDEDQRLRHPTDTAGRLVQRTEDAAITLKWPE